METLIVIDSVSVGLLLCLAQSQFVLLCNVIFA